MVKLNYSANIGNVFPGATNVEGAPIRRLTSSKCRAQSADLAKSAQLEYFSKFAKEGAGVLTKSAWFAISCV